MQMSLEKITPEIAAAYLSTSNGNRSMNKNYIKFLIGQMRSGSFAVTHQAIAFDNHGSLVDGHHRLTAIRDAGFSVELWVARGVTRESLLVVDTGKPRSSADSFTMLGYKCSNSTAAVARNLWYLWCHQQWGIPWGDNNKARVANTILLEFLKFHRQAIDWSMDVKKTKGLTNSCITAAIAAAYYTSDINRLTEFRDSLQSGVVNNASTDNSVLRLRDYVMRLPAGAGGNQFRCELFYRTATAIVAFLERRGLSKICVSYKNSFVLPQCDLSLKPVAIQAEYDGSAMDDFR